MKWQGALGRWMRRWRQGWWRRWWAVRRWMRRRRHRRRQGRRRGRYGRGWRWGRGAWGAHGRLRRRWIRLRPRKRLERRHRRRKRWRVVRKRLCTRQNQGRGCEQCHPHEERCGHPRLLGRPSACPSDRSSQRAYLHHRATASGLRRDLFNERAVSPAGISSRDAHLYVQCAARGSARWNRLCGPAAELIYHLPQAVQSLEAPRRDARPVCEHAVHAKDVVVVDGEISLGAVACTYACLDEPLGGLVI